MTNSAAFVGRVGGLAVALGIGAAVACSQQVAWADNPDSSSDPGGSASSSASSESSSGSSGSSGTAPGHSPAGPPAGSTTANTISNDSSASKPTTADEDSNIGPVDTDSDPDTETPPAEEPAEKPPASTARSRYRGYRRLTEALPALRSPRHATQAHPQADIKPTSDPKTQSLSTSSTKRAYIGQTTVDSGTTTAKGGPINPTRHVAGNRQCGRKSTGDRRERPGGTRIVDNCAAGRHQPAGRRRPQPVGGRQPASPGRAPADAVWCAGMDTPRDPEDLLQSAPHHRLQPRPKQLGRRQHRRQGRRQRSRRHRLHLDRHQACQRRGSGESRRQVRLHAGSGLRRPGYV